MGNRILYCCIFVVFNVGTSASAQRLHERTPYSFYQEWSLDVEESKGNLMVYRSKGNLRPITSSNEYPFLKFNRRHYLLYFLSPKAPKTTKPTKPTKPLKWSNAPKITPKYRHRCGNEFPVKKNKIKRQNRIKSNWKKGNWKVFIKNQTRFLVIEHKVSKNGKDYKLNKKDEFQIVSLKEDKMVLRKINLHEEDL